MQAISDGQSKSSLAALDDAISHVNEVLSANLTNTVLARAVNGVSKSMEKLFAFYKPLVPPKLMTLDYIGREIQLDAIEKDFAQATTD